MAFTRSSSLKLIFQRAAQGALVTLVVTAVAFRLISAAGGDVLSGMRGAPFITRTTLEYFERIYNLDQPLLVRYVRWLMDAARFDLGRSYHYDRPVAGVLWPSFFSTAMLAGLAMIMAWTAALVLGFASNRRAGSWIERGCDVIVTAASSTPTILLALIALLLAANTAPLAGEPGLILYLFGSSAIAVPLTAAYLSQTRACLADAAEEEYPLLARAKGAGGFAFFYRHLLRPSMGPMISIAGASFGALLSGSVIVEQTLNLPGLGSLSVEAIRFRDTPIVMGVVLISAVAVLAGNLLSDLFRRWNDPRIS